MLRRKVVPLRVGFALIVACIAVFTLANGASASSAVTAANHAARHELTAVKAAVLGAVEGVTEYLPVSSTGHLLIAERLMDVGATKATKDVADTYTVVIQAGAILAVLVLFWKRIVEVLKGLIGRSVEGRRLLIVLLLGFIPAAIAGAVGEKKIKAHLLAPIPVTIAWAVGAAAILLVGTRLHQQGKTTGRSITEITNREAMIIGVAQILALWPGTSRSLVTILAALMIGLSLSAAVEFSFLLGLLTLGAATAKDLVSNGKQMFDAYGVVNPTIGFVVAFIAAMIAIRWMLQYLQRHSLNVFAYYRFAAAAITIVLLAAGTISNSI